MDDGEDSEVEGRCPHCGKEWTYSSEKIKSGLVPRHSYQNNLCPGSREFCRRAWDYSKL